MSGPPDDGSTFLSGIADKGTMSRDGCPNGDRPRGTRAFEGDAGVLAFSRAARRWLTVTRLRHRTLSEPGYDRLTVIDSQPM